MSIKLISAAALSVALVMPALAEAPKTSTTHSNQAVKVEAPKTAQAGTPSTTTPAAKPADHKATGTHSTTPAAAPAAKVETPKADAGKPAAPQASTSGAEKKAEPVKTDAKPVESKPVEIKK